MRLVKLHIENFGTFSSRDYAFDRGLNVFCEENGYGKTTMAAFIKAMFYGMPNSDGRTSGFNDRKHYLPFGGGKYGGSLTFEMDGAEYRIERIFDPNSTARDSLNVYRNNVPYGKLGKDIGRAVFGVDREAFERTVFIDSGKIKMSASDSISAKLNSIAGGVKSGETITAATGELLKEAKRYRPLAGKGGKIPELEQKVDKLSDDIRKTEDEAATLGWMYGRYNELTGEIRTLEEQKNLASKAAVVSAQWKTYDSLVAQQQSAQCDYDVIVAAYPQGIPSEDEIAQLKNYNERIQKNINAMDIKAFGGEQKQRLDSLKGRFAAGVPDDGALDEADKKAMQCHVLEQELEGLKVVRTDERLAGLEHRFAGGVPDSGMIAACEQNISALRDTDMKITSRMTAARPQTQAQQPQGKKGGKWHIVLAVIALLVIIGGIALMLINTVAGGALAGVGALLLIVTAVLYFNGKKSSAAAVPDVNIDDTLADLQYKKSKYTEELRAFLAKYGYYSASAEGDFAALKNDVREFTELKSRERQTAQDIADKTEKLQALKGEIYRLLAAYGVTNDDLQAGLRTLRALKDEYVRLCNAQRQAAGDVQAADNDINASYSGAKAILAKYGIALGGGLDEVIESIESALKDAVRLKVDVENRRKEAESYRTEKCLTERPLQGEEGSTDIDSLSDRLDEKIMQKVLIEADISSIEDRVDQLEGLRNSLAGTKEELAAAEMRYKMLTAARTMLEAAQQNLKDKYVSPVKDRFTYYAGKIEETLGDKVSMDGDFSVSFERGGAITSDDYLSAGQHCVCALCFRLALIDNMYPAEQPFIVMDDPFVHLDEGHLKDALKLVKALAKDRQIIYYCCHSSRCA